MLRVKVFIILIFVFAVAAIVSCAGSKSARFSIVDSKSYEASLFHQNCAICHGPEGEGKLLDNGTKVPSLREGEFKFKTKAEIHKQISDGGNGMVPFRGQLTARELNLMTDFVYDKLRNSQ